MSARILIIEDNINNLALMVYLLQAFGHVTLQAQDGVTGLLMAKHEIPDLIICDIHLPLSDGFVVADLIRKDEILRNTALVAVTALAMVGDQEIILKAGFDGYITKPITPETFVGEIEDMLLRKRLSLEICL